MPRKANIGDTVRSISGDEFVVLKEEYDEKDDVQWVWRCNCDETEDCIYFSPCSYGMPDQNFEVIKKANEKEI